VSDHGIGFARFEVSERMHIITALLLVGLMFGRRATHVMNRPRFARDRLGGVFGGEGVACLPIEVPWRSAWPAPRFLGASVRESGRRHGRALRREGARRPGGAHPRCGSTHRLVSAVALEQRCRGWPRRDGMAGCASVRRGAPAWWPARYRRFRAAEALREAAGTCCRYVFASVRRCTPDGTPSERSGVSPVQVSPEGCVMLS